jgi:hypothetical protein
MRAVDPIIMELDQEAATTKRVLERVPDNRLAWKPVPSIYGPSADENPFAG